jgi:hypothetical protein
MILGLKQHDETFWGSELINWERGKLACLSRRLCNGIGVTPVGGQLRAI